MIEWDRRRRNIIEEQYLVLWADVTGDSSRLYYTWRPHVATLEDASASDDEVAVPTATCDDVPDGAEHAAGVNEPPPGDTCPGGFVAVLAAEAERKLAEAVRNGSVEGQERATEMKAAAAAAAEAEQLKAAALADLQKPPLIPPCRAATVPRRGRCGKSCGAASPLASASRC